MRNEVIEKLAALVTVAFGLVAALAWNSAIQAVFARFFGTAQTLIANIAYAVFVTVIAVIATIWIGKIAEKSKKK
jgi:membrane protein YdbS with pleckstrin-like domain